MVDKTRGRKPKTINDITDSEIMKFRDQIVLKNNRELNSFLIFTYFIWICLFWRLI
jgi:hypothetical protein